MHTTSDEKVFYTKVVDLEKLHLSRFDTNRDKRGLQPLQRGTILSSRLVSQTGTKGSIFSPGLRHQPGRKRCHPFVPVGFSNRDKRVFPTFVQESLCAILIGPGWFMCNSVGMENRNTPPPVDRLFSFVKNKRK